ncbi:MAG: 2-amino-3,7-dideoxy-D-threo-hept-6-ulosonate synthase [Chloroflexota bacterium]
MSIGKQIRMERLFRQSRTVIVPVDQSLTSGPIAGLEDMRQTIGGIVAGGADAVLMQRGPLMAGLWTPGTASALIVHLSGGTQFAGTPQLKTPVCEVETALQLGADAVSVHISLGLSPEQDNEALAGFGAVSTQCLKWGLPLLAMMYVYGNPPDPAGAIIHAARVGCDLGADLIKVNYTGDPESFSRLVDTAYVPVVMAGGPVTEDGLATLQTIETALAAGAAGVCIGRNVYQHRQPGAMVQAIQALVRQNSTAVQAYAEFIQPHMPA